MTEREKMLLGEQFEMLDPQLSEDRRRAAALLGRLNALSMDASGYRDTLGELLPHASDECLIRPPFYCDYGYSLFIGRGVFINFNCVMLDGAPIRIGDHVLNLQESAKELRDKQLRFSPTAQSRAKARAEKNWAESDRLRDEITALGYVLKDTKQGQQVTKAI